MGAVTPDTTVYAENNAQPEFTELMWQYINRRCSGWRVMTGKERAKEYAGLLSRIEKDYGVDRYILLGLWGMESSYGDVIINKKYMMGFLSALPPVILKTIEGISGTRKVLVNVGRSFKLTPTQQFWKILFPAALPTIFVGIRLGLIFALINVVGTEFLINFGGLGQLINDLAERYDLAGTYAAICFVVLVSVLFFMGLEKAERWLRPVA